MSRKPIRIMITDEGEEIKLKRKRGRPRNRINKSVETDPTYEFEEEVNQCVICLEKLKEDSCAINCGHVFHKTCLFNWFSIILNEKRSCPLCRRPAEIVKRIRFH